MTCTSRVARGALLAAAGVITAITMLIIPAQPTEAAPRCGDLTGDGRVSGVDVAREVQAIIRRNTHPRYDINGDGRVNWQDFNAILRQLGRRCTAEGGTPPPTPTPTPPADPEPEPTVEQD